VLASPTLGGVSVSRYSARLDPLNDPRCQSGDLDIQIDGRSAGATTEWNSFWRERLAYPERPLKWMYDVAIPPFLGISGQVVEAGTVTPQSVSRHEGALVRDGTQIRAFAGTTVCGAVTTQTLTGSKGDFGGNLFRLIVPPTSVKSGCGTPVAQITFCVGDFKARQPAAGPFSYPSSPEAKPVQWAGPGLADITLEPTTEPCLAVEAPRLPQELPSTGGPPN
jgi:hypothetical protein